MPFDFQPRYTTATAELPGDQQLWDMLLDQSDAYSYQTAMAEKGGPFGAQLWAVNKATGEMVLFGTPDNMEDSNAVVSKGLASAHAEAENLSEDNRERAARFLAENQTPDMEWEIVQVSSGESCPSCRSKQVNFSQTLKNAGLISDKGFNVLYKATYEQTKQVAGFDDKPFDVAFRAINQLGVMKSEDGLFSLQAAIEQNDETRLMAESGELIYKPVDLISATDIGQKIMMSIGTAGEVPFAVVVDKQGNIMSYAADEREYPSQFENGAIMKALQSAAQKQKIENPDKFESWDLDGATLVTNIKAIGPGAYAEALWYNLSGIQVVKEFTSGDIDMAAAEIEGLSNVQAWELSSQEYNVRGASINVRHTPAEEEMETAGPVAASQLFWAAKMRYESLLRRQSERLTLLREQGYSGFTLFDGAEYHHKTYNELVQFDTRNTDYNPKVESHSHPMPE